MKKTTKNEMRRVLKIAKVREEMHCLPDKDDREFKLYQLYRVVVDKLFFEGFRTKKQQKEEEKYDYLDLTEEIIVKKINDLLKKEEVF